MKKWISVLLICLLAVMLISAAPADVAVPAVVGADVAADPGDTVDMPLTVVHNPGIAYLRVTVVCDTGITVSSVTNGSIIKDFDKGTNLVWSADEDSTANGTLATLSLAVSSSAAKGEHTVQVLIRECYNADFDDVALAAYNGTVTVGAAEPETPTLTGITVASLPEKTKYTVGEAFQSKGLTLTAHYSDSSVQTVTKGYSLSGFQSTTAGIQTVTVTYEGKTAAFTVIVEEAAIVETDALFRVGSGKLRIGSTVEVPIELVNNPGIVSLKLMVRYDAARLKLTEIRGADFSGAAFGPQTSNPIAVNWIDTLHGNNTTDGTVAVLVFEAADNASEGEAAISVSYDAEDVFDASYDNIAFQTAAGTVKLFSYIPGDVNRDNLVNNKDLGLLMQYLNGWDVSIDEEAADVYRNDAVNNKDYGILLQYLNNWDVTLQ